jgi:hypothetical protein
MGNTLKLLTIFLRFGYVLNWIQNRWILDEKHVPLKMLHVCTFQASLYNFLSHYAHLWQEEKIKIHIIN